MPGVPSWQAPTTGYAPLAAHGSQFLATHEITYLWSGIQQAAGAGGTASVTSSYGLWIAQQFTAGASQSAAGYAVLGIGTTATAPDVPWVISLQATAAGAPSGTPLASAEVPKELVVSGGYAAALVPLPATGLAPAATYWIVAEAAGASSGACFQWQRSSAGSGASTSTNGTSWTAQSYGLVFEAFDQSPVPPLAAIWEDAGGRWTSLAYSSGLLTGIGELTAGQAANGYAVSSRVLSYTDGLLAGVA